MQPKVIVVWGLAATAAAFLLLHAPHTSALAPRRGLGAAGSGYWPKSAVSKQEQQQVVREYTQEQVGSREQQHPHYPQLHHRHQHQWKQEVPQQQQQQQQHPNSQPHHHQQQHQHQVPQQLLHARPLAPRSLLQTRSSGSADRSRCVNAYAQIGAGGIHAALTSCQRETYDQLRCCAQVGGLVAL